MSPKTRSRKSSSKPSVDTANTNGGTSNPTSTSANPDAVNNMRQSHVQSASDLPPPREHKRLKHRTSPPLQRAPWFLFNYTFVAITFLVAAYYFYQMFVWKTQVGGWWNMALGRRPPQMQQGGAQPPRANTGGAWWGGSGKGKGESKGAPESGDSLVQSKIDALAEALGMRSEDLSSAIAGAVREHVPPASLSSVAAKETGRAARILAGDEDAAGQASVVGSVADGIGKVVGFDEPPEGSE